MVVEWISIPAGIVAGGLSGWGAAWINRPAAAAAAEEAKARIAARRKLVDDGRALVAAADGGGWSPERVALDKRFIALRRHLSNDSRAAYEVEYGPQLRIPQVGRPSHEVLKADVEGLDQKWKLS